MTTDIINAYQNLIRAITGDQTVKLPADAVQILKDADEAIATLSSKGAHVLQLRFGLTGLPRQSLKDVGANPAIAVGVERVRQLEAKALRNMRHPERLSLVLRNIPGQEERAKNEAKYWIECQQDCIKQKAMRIAEYEAEEAIRNAKKRLSAEDENFKSALVRLLARIHRDGGHYIAEHGFEKAVSDAHEIVEKLHSNNAARWSNYQ